MWYYVFALCWAYFTILMAKRLPNFSYLLFVVPLVLFSIFRGESGPDTVNYINKFLDVEVIISDKFFLDAEPVLYLIMYLSDLIKKADVQVFFLFHASIITSIFYFLSQNFNKYKYFLLTVGVVFVVDGLTNTLRVSLAYFIFLYGYGSRYRYCYYALSFFSHVSSLIVILFEITAKKIKLKFNANNSWRLAIVFIVILVAYLHIDSIISISSRVDDKFEQYKELSTKNTFSGVSDIFVISSLLFVGSFYNRDHVVEIIIDAFVILLIAWVLYFGAMSSIGFLRILKLLIIGITLSPFLVESKREIPDYILFMIGFLYTLNFLRIIYFGDGYLPYGIIY